MLWQTSHGETRGNKRRTISAWPNAAARKLMIQLRRFLWKHEEKIVGYLFILPDVAGLGLFLGFGIFFALYTSLHHWSGLTPMRFIGLANYVKLFSDYRFLHSLMITVKYVVLLLPLVIIVPLLIALLVNIKIPARNTFRVIYFLPVVMSLPIASIVWHYIMGSSRQGILNFFFSLVGLGPIRWLSSKEWSLISIVLVSLWRWMGYNMIIFLAGLQDIPKEYYEAAHMDGANSFQRFFYLTLPLLRPTNFFLILTSIIGSFQVFDQVYVMTGGGPARSSQVIVMEIYENAFEFFRMGKATSMAMILFFILFVTSYTYMKMYKSGRIT